jgi:hypothetical protein
MDKLSTFDNLQDILDYHALILIPVSTVDGKVVLIIQNWEIACDIRTQ